MVWMDDGMSNDIRKLVKSLSYAELYALGKTTGAATNGQHKRLGESYELWCGLHDFLHHR